MREIKVGMKKFMFEISVPNEVPLVLAASGEREMKEWIKAITICVGGDLEEVKVRKQQTKKKKKKENLFIFIIREGTL